MPEETPASASLPTRREAAFGAVGNWLASLPGTVRQLDAGELRAYAGRHAIHGWRLEVAFPDGVRRIDILADKAFPRTPMRVMLLDRPPFLTWPHVEEDGALCLLPEIAEVSASNPAAAARNVLGGASRLIEDCLAGTNEEDFRTEFGSYWYWARTEGCTPVRSLLAAAGPTRPIRVWRGQAFYLLGEDEASINAWLRNLFDADKPHTTEPAMLLWLARPLLPREYPSSAEDVMALARNAGGDAAAQLERLAATCPEAVVVAIGADSSNGPCLGAVTVTPRKGGSLQNGFPPGRVPERILSQRFFGGAKVIRSSLDRVDPAWVHGRGRDPRFAKLRDSRVLVLGCGSIGAPVALALAEAGVGRLGLVDPDRLTWANVGRHPLGADTVDLNKAVALAKRIRRSYPHIEVEAYPTCWEALPGGLGDERIAGDLIVTAVGRWASEGGLNEWHLCAGRSPAVVYGWTEPHACAGHAVAITKTGGCLECGFDDAGTPRLCVCGWESETTLQEPACGAMFQPYGPIELAHIVAVIAELAMDCLLGTVATSTHRIWADRRRRLTEMGGSWTGEWVKIAGNRLDGGFLHESVWAASADCRMCQLAPAA